MLEEKALSQMIYHFCIKVRVSVAFLKIHLLRASMQLMQISVFLAPKIKQVTSSLQSKLVGFNRTESHTTS